MPTYKFRNKETGEVFEKWMLMAEREPYLEANPDLIQMPTLLNSVSEVGDFQNKTDGGWNEVLHRVSKVPGSVIKPYK
ncbi:MAG: hypothetical protein ACO25L_01330 [Candidatus Nanopelagicales bacterium]|nr:transcriptional regulator [Synechococcus phage DSL-LC03]